MSKDKKIHSVDQITSINSDVDDGDAIDKLFLRIDFAGEETILSVDQLPFNIGRDEAVNHLVIDSHLASRQHGQIAIESGKVVYRDSSRNGTFIKEGIEETVFVRNETFMLSHSGFIKLGDFLDLADEDLIRYRISLIAVPPNNSLQ